MMFYVQSISKDITVTFIPPQQESLFLISHINHLSTFCITETSLRGEVYTVIGSIYPLGVQSNVGTVQEQPLYKAPSSGCLDFPLRVHFHHLFTFASSLTLQSISSMQADAFSPVSWPSTVWQGRRRTVTYTTQVCGKSDLPWPF